MDFSSVVFNPSNRLRGFTTVRQLRTSNCAGVPDTAGVYLILRGSSHPPRFTTPSPAGWHKSKGPTVSQDKLASNWVEGAIVLHIGKAGGHGSESVLRERLRSYISFGAGKPVGHWGGRLIWQLDDSDDLLVCWRSCEDAVDLEKSLIRDFSNTLRCEQLSGGLRRRAQIARVLATPVPCYFLDEPSSGLDAKARREFWQLLAGLMDELRATVFLTTHSTDEVAALCDDLILINRGEVRVCVAPGSWPGQGG